MQFPDEAAQLKQAGRAFQNFTASERAAQAANSLILWHALFEASPAARKKELLKNNEAKERIQFLNFIRSFNARNEQRKASSS